MITVSFNETRKVPLISQSVSQSSIGQTVQLLAEPAQVRSKPFSQRMLKASESFLRAAFRVTKMKIFSLFNISSCSFKEKIEFYLQMQLEKVILKRELNFSNRLLLKLRFRSLETQNLYSEVRETVISSLRRS